MAHDHWGDLMATSANALRELREQQGDAEADLKNEYRREIEEVTINIAGHTAFQHAIMSALVNATIRHGISIATIFPAKNHSELTKCITEVKLEGQRLYKSGVGIDKIRAAGMKYKPPGVR